MNNTNFISVALIKQISEALKPEPQILAAYVLGSIVIGLERSDSDFDLAVVVNNRHEVRDDHVYDLLQKVSFPKNLDLSVVDLAVSPLFLFQIVKTGSCIYKKTQKDMVAFTAAALKNYYDTQHMRNIYYHYLKQKFNGKPYVH